MARRTALLEEAQAFSASLHDIRAAFGNPFFYSHPENADESEAHYTAFENWASAPTSLKRPGVSKASWSEWE